MAVAVVEVGMVVEASLIPVFPDVAKALQAVKALVKFITWMSGAILRHRFPESTTSAYEQICSWKTRHHTKQKGGDDEAVTVIQPIALVVVGAYIKACVVDE